MIVKNEERNIEKALAWSKNAVYEQIVADTGSTDRTIELSERMGAKVFHFEWINDFSAARNFSIEQATGDWILIIDADEYFPEGDAEKLIKHIEQVESEPDAKENCIAFSCPILNIDDSGKPMSMVSNVRVFRNIPSIRYTGRIHEQHYIDASKVRRMSDIRLIHTGYSETARKDAGKLERNVGLLRAELAANPEDINIKAFLADSLKQSTDDTDIAEAAKLFAEVLESGGLANHRLRIKAYVFFLNKFVNDPDKQTECEEICRSALEEFPKSLDFEYFLASIMNYKGEYRAAMDLLRTGEQRLEKGDYDIGTAMFVPADPTMLYGQILLAAQGLGDIEQLTRYAMLILKADKNRQDILRPLIATLLKNGKTEDTLLTQLADIYNMSDMSDLLLLARTAKESGAIALAQKIIEIAAGIK
jgi:glycosyltransferase involved in cell wall biosynthesis